MERGDAWPTLWAFAASWWKAGGGMKTDSVPTVPNQCVTWEMTMTPSSDWPYISTLELQANAASVPSARSHARAVIVEWGLEDISEDVELIVSELVTNAIEASLRAASASQWPGAEAAPVRLWVASDLDAVLLQVWDNSPEVPVRRKPRRNDERGRGLMLVRQICRAWGTYRQGTGKVVWVAV